MFEVMYKDDFYRVHSVRDNIESGLPDFLIYINYHWTWVSCIHCTPSLDE